MSIKPVWQAQLVEKNTFAVITFLGSEEYDVLPMRRAASEPTLPKHRSQPLRCINMQCFIQATKNDDNHSQLLGSAEAGDGQADSGTHRENEKAERMPQPASGHAEDDSLEQTAADKELHIP